MSGQLHALAPLAAVTLEGRVVRLEPLRAGHAPDLRVAAADPEIWRWVRVPITSEARFDAWLETALSEAQRGTSLPFAIVDRESSRAIGSTRYFDVKHEHLGLEIGHTWLARPAWRTAVNTECKYLLLSHAFERLGCVRVQLKTNALNARSRAAIERIGGKLEGVLRKHLKNADGETLRDTALYSLIDEEWPAVKAALEARLDDQRFRPPPPDHR